MVHAGVLGNVMYLETETHEVFALRFGKCHKTLTVIWWGFNVEIVLDILTHVWLGEYAELSSKYIIYNW